jgi:hypothetical protein
MPLSLGLRMGLSAGSSLFGWVPAVEGSSAAVAFNGTQFALPAYGPDLCSATTTTTVTTVAGKLYELSATGSGTITIAVGTAASGTDILTAATYATARYFTAVGTTTHLTVTVTTGSLTDILVREVTLGEMGTNLGASGYTMTAGAGTATESPSGTLTLASGGTADLSIGSLTVGAHYRVICLVATNAATVQVGTSSGGTQTVPATSLATGVGAIEFTATATTHHLRFTRAAAGNTVVSSITVAQWTPRPTLRTASFSEVFAFTASSTTARTYVGSDGLIKNDLAADAPRVDYSNGKARYLFENQSTNLVLWSRDLTNAAWTKSNMTTAQTATGADGVANSATTLTATAGNATALQAITSASSARITGCRIRRRTGSGTVELTQDNGTTWTPVTVTTSWTRVSIASVTSTNPTVGIRIVTSGDAVDVDYFQHEAQAFLSADIPTTTATVTRLIETARFSPLVEAIVDSPGVTVRVQGASIISVNSSYPRLIGANNFVTLLHRANTNEVGTYNGTTLLQGGGSPAWTTGFGAVAGINSTGRSVSGGSTAATDTVNAGTRSLSYLARSLTLAAGEYGNGYYSSFALWPFRATNANVSSLAVAPT